MRTTADLAKTRSKGISNFKRVCNTLRTVALRGGCFPKSLWALLQTAERGVSAVREETYACQPLVTERRIVHSKEGKA